jgi:hypothetical protein
MLIGSSAAGRCGVGLGLTLPQPSDPGRLSSATTACTFADVPKPKEVPTEQAAAGQRMKDLRLRYGWKQHQIFSEHGQVSAVESGRNPLDARELVDAYTSAFRVDSRTLSDYQGGLITLDEFIVRAGVTPGDSSSFSGDRDRSSGDKAPGSVPSGQSAAPASVRSLGPWEHEEVEELLVLTLVNRGMPRLVAHGVVHSERFKLRDYPSWPLRIAHLESVREAEEEDARLALAADKPQPSKLGANEDARASDTARAVETAASKHRSSSGKGRSANKKSR